MARTFTLAQLRTKVRERADMVNSTFCSDSEINGYINASYTWLYDILVKSGLGYYAESTQSITASGAATVNLPADYYATLGVDYQAGADRWVELFELMPQERNRYGVGTAGDQALGYRITGTTITFYPTPASGQVYRHIYIPAPTNLSGDSDTVDGVSGWEELIVVDAAIKCLQKEESNTVPLERDRERLMARIEEMAENRALNTPRRVVDVYGDAVDPDWPAGRHGVRW